MLTGSEDFPDVGTLGGSRKAPIVWASVDTAPPPKPKRRYKKILKREAAAAAQLAIAAALASQTSPNSKRQLNKTELQELSRKALEETYLRVKLKKEPRDPNVKCFNRENEEGNVEYKLRLKDPQEGNPYRIQQLITQMKFRLAEGNGECFYYIGLEDDGYPKGLEAADLQGSLSTLHFMAQALGASVHLVRELPGAAGRMCALARVRKETQQPVAFTDLRVAVSGGVDSGKSSLVAVLSHGSNGVPDLDNGRGSARMTVLKHKHELESGRTSSISQQVLGYGSDNQVLNYQGVSSLTAAEISCSASRLLTFIDMGGHERCLKTCLWGMTCLLPDYAMLCICASGGLGRMSKEHLAVAVALEIPLAVVLTKCDLVDAARLEAVVGQVRALLALALPGLRPKGVPEDEESIEVVAPLVETNEEACHCAAVLCRMRACSSLGERRQVRLPIFMTSAVSGAGLQLLHRFLRELQPSVQLMEEQQQQQQQHQAPKQCPQSAAAATAAAAAVAGLHITSDAASSSSAGVSVLAPAPGHAASSPLPVPNATMEAPVMFQVDQTFDLHRVGSVVCGTVVQGVIRVGQNLLLGPDQDGAFLPVLISGMQRMHTPVSLVRAGQTAALALTPLLPGLGWGGTKGSCSGSRGFMVPTALGSDMAAGAQNAGVAQEVDGGSDGGGVGVGGQGSSAKQRLRMSPGALSSAYCSLSVPSSPSRSSLCLLRGAGATPTGAAATAGAGTAKGAGACPLLLHSPRHAEGTTVPPPTHGLGLAEQQQQQHEVQQREQQEQEQEHGEEEDMFAGLGAFDDELDDDAGEDLFAALGTFEHGQHEETWQHQGQHKQQRQQQRQNQQQERQQPQQQRGDQQQQQQQGMQQAMQQRQQEQEMQQQPPQQQLANEVEAVVMAASGYTSDDLGQQGRGRAGSGAGGEGLVLRGEAHRLQADRSSRLQAVGQQQQRRRRRRQQDLAGAGLGSKALWSATQAPDSSCHQHQLASGCIRSLLSRPAGAEAGAGVGTGSPARAHRPASPQEEEDEAVADWHAACELATSPPAPHFLPLAASPPNARKGAVLLDAAFLGAAGSGTCWEFQAVVVLLGGRWPARGLVSGRWPPVGSEEELGGHGGREGGGESRKKPGQGGAGGEGRAVRQDSGSSTGGACTPCTSDPSAATSDNDTSGRPDQRPPTGSEQLEATAVMADGGSCGGGPLPRPSGGGHRLTRHGSSCSGEHVVMLHCGSVRQAATVIWMQELEVDHQQQHPPHPRPQSAAAPEDLALDLDPVKYCGIRATAAILQHDCSGQGPAAAVGSSSGEEVDSPRATCREDLGCIVHVCFRFLNRPEWIRQGARLIIRDRSDGHIAGAGFLDKVK